MIARILPLVLVALLVVPFAQESHPADAKKKGRGKTITRTFTNTDTIEMEADGDVLPYPSPVNVGGFRKGKIKDVDLVLHEFSHSHPFHVDVLLVAPNGRRATVLSDVGGLAAANDLTLTLDDEAGSGLHSGLPALSSGRFKPTNFGADDSFPDPAPEATGNAALSVFNGGKPNGQWRLFVVDDTASHAGAFSGGWSIEITAKVKKNKKK